MTDDGGISRLRQRLNAIPQAVKEAIQPALQKSADEIVAAMQHLAPEDEGDLKGSIRHEPGEHELQLKIKAGGEATTKPVRQGSTATYDYAMAAEFGTTKAAAQPFFFPAYRLNKKKAQRRIKRAISSAVKKHWGRP